MKLYINENPCEIDSYAEKNLSDIINLIEQNALPDMHVITTVKLNGAVLSLEDEKEIAGKYPYERIESLEIISAEPRQLMLEGFQMAPDVLSELLQSFGIVIEKLRQGEANQGIIVFQKCLEWLQWFNDILNLTTNLAKFDYSHIALEKANISTLNLNLLNVYAEIVEAQQNNDWINLSDILEYELSPLLEEWIRVLPTFQDYLEKQLRQPN